MSDKHAVCFFTQEMSVKQLSLYCIQAEIYNN